MDKTKIISANKNIVILLLYGHSFTSKYSAQVHLSYTYLWSTSLYNNSPLQLYPTSMLLVCSMLNVGFLTYTCTVWTRTSAVFIHLLVSTMLNPHWWWMYSSCNFGRMLSVGAILFEDRFCASKKGGIGRGGWVHPELLCTWHLPWLGVEKPWSALPWPFLSFLTQRA